MESHHVLWLLGIAACTQVVSPPATWPQSGCSATAPDSLDDVVGDDPLVEERYQLETDDGVKLEVNTIARRDLDCMGAVLIIPPGLDPGAALAGKTAGRQLAEAGLYVVSFDPRGRGESEGAEDVNGYQGQDDTASLMRQLASEDWVDPTHVLVHSRSFGAALAAGSMARHADLAPIGWVDYESPGWLSEDLAHTTEHTQTRFEGLAEASGDVEAFWEQREPARFMGEVRTSYRRLQGWPDHALDYVDAAVAMVNGATAASAVYYNDALVEDEITSAEVREDAVDGGLDPGDELVIEQILLAVQDE